MRFVAVLVFAVAGCGVEVRSQDPKTDEQVVVDYIKKLTSFDTDVHIKLNTLKVYEARWPATRGLNAFAFEHIHKAGDRPYHRDAKPAKIVYFQADVDGNKHKGKAQQVLLIQDGKMIGIVPVSPISKYDEAITRSLTKIAELEKAN